MLKISVKSLRYTDEFSSRRECTIGKYKASDCSKVTPDLADLVFFLSVYDISKILVLAIFD